MTTSTEAHPTPTGSTLSALLSDLRTVRTLPDQDPRREAWLTAKRDLVARLDQR